MDDKEALGIIRRLADGVDPFTGEVFEADSLYQNVEVVRALNRAIEALSWAAERAERKKNLPARAGKPWDKGESDLLIERFDEGMGIAQLAKEHQRTRGAIEAQLGKLGKIDARGGRR